MSELVSQKLMLVTLAMSSIIFSLLITAISFEFLSEEIAKVFVVPVLVAAMFISAGVIITSFKSST